MGDLVQALLKKRKSLGASVGDYVDKLGDLLNMVEEQGGILDGVTKRVVLSQGSVFFFGGFETTANTPSNALYFLMKNQDVQEKCLRDILAIVDDPKNVNYDSVAEMKYLEAVILETLRMVPLILRNERICNQDTIIKGVKIRKGVRVDVPSFALHHHPEIYGDNADTFNPERFITGGRSANDITFQSFGAGPRICIGRRLAMLEIKVVLAKILLEFKLEDNPGAKLDFMTGNITMIQPKTVLGIFKPRKNMAGHL